MLKSQAGHSKIKRCHLISPINQEQVAEVKGKLIYLFSHFSYSEDDVGLNSNSEDLSLSNDLVLETKRRLRSLEAEADVSTFTHFS